jgi:hypothetical protein
MGGCGIKSREIWTCWLLSRVCPDDAAAQKMSQRCRVVFAESSASVPKQPPGRVWTIPPSSQVRFWHCGMREMVRLWLRSHHPQEPSSEASAYHQRENAKTANIMRPLQKMLGKHRKPKTIARIAQFLCCCKGWWHSLCASTHDL